MSALSATIAYSTMGASSISGAWLFAGKNAANAILSNIIPPIEVISIGNYGISISPVAMLTARVDPNARRGFIFGAGVTHSYKIGDWTLSTGGDSRGRAFGGFSYDDGKNGFSYYHTAYMQGDRQRTGTIGARKGDVSLQWENDVFARSGDKFRSNAIEVGYKGYSIGTNVYTTYSVDDYKTEYGKKINGSDLWNNKFGTHEYGWTLSSPLYIGIKNKNGGVTRIGYNRPEVGDFVQNGFHHIPGINSPNFKKGNFSSSFIQQGINTPHSLY